MSLLFSMRHTLEHSPPHWVGPDGHIGEVEMGILESMDKRTKKFGILDLELAQGATMFFALIVAKLMPRIMEISIWDFVAAVGGLCNQAVLCVLDQRVSVSIQVDLSLGAVYGDSSTRTDDLGGVGDVDHRRQSIFPSQNGAVRQENCPCS
jgi:hypothetical protein